jgi:hypothetical protein
MQNAKARLLIPANFHKEVILLRSLYFMVAPPRGQYTGRQAQMQNKAKLRFYS